jgi:hypothetical protein
MVSVLAAPVAPVPEFVLEPNCLVLEANCLVLEAARPEGAEPSADALNICT